MALYSYRSLSRQGKRIAGFVDAASLADAKKQLIQKDLFIVSLEQSDDYSSSQPWYKRIFSGKVTLKDKILFTKQLAILLKSGIQILPALELLIEQFEGKMRSIIVTLKDGVKEGLSLADGLAKYPKIFDNIFVQLVRAGEATGKLESILVRLTDYLERRRELQKKISKAMQYPIMQLLIIGIVVVTLLVKVVPQMAQQFSNAGSKLPWPTQWVLNLSNFFQSYYLLILVFSGILTAAFIYWKSTPNGAKILDRIKLKMPMIKFFAKTSAVVQFSNTLGMLLESGVNLSEALNIVCKIISNRVLSDQLVEAKEKIIKEGKISQYLKKTGIFPSIAIYLIKTGEESGELAQMLLTVGSNYEEELSELTDKLTARMQPIIMIFMAIVVGFIVLSIALPIIGMTKLAGKM